MDAIRTNTTLSNVGQEETVDFYKRQWGLEVSYESRLHRTLAFTRASIVGDASYLAVGSFPDPR